jgi:cell division protein FtsI (penicillin-binding protein 3)
VVVVLSEPGAGLYYGGDVAAPVFAGVVGGALRLLAVAPDQTIPDSHDAQEPLTSAPVHTAALR